MYPLSSGSSSAHYAPEPYSGAAAIQVSKEVGYKGLYSVEASRNTGPIPAQLCRPSWKSYLNTFRNIL